MHNVQMRSWITLCEAARREPTFADVVRSPRRYIYALQDAADSMGENIYDYFEGDEENTGEAYEKRIIASQLQDSAQKFLSHMQGGKMTVYRGMEVGKGWNPAREGLGIYWTIRESAAFHGILMQGIVQEKDIDIWKSLAMEFTALTEDEIRLLPTATIMLTRIKLNGRPVMKQFWGQTYQAVPQAAAP